MRIKFKNPATAKAFYDKHFKKKYLYLIENNFINAYKYGCTNDFEDRLKYYKEKNLRLYYPEYGIDKQGKESDINIIKVIRTDEAEELEKELHKLRGKKLMQIPGTKYYYKEHYSKDNIELHKNILAFFDSISLNNPI